MPVKFYLIAVFCLLVLVPAKTSATHLRGGEITVKLLSCASNQYLITLTLYTNINTTAIAGGSNLFFGDGTSIFFPDKSNTVIDPQYGIGIVVFTVVHSYSVSGQYLLTYSEGNRNNGILNITNSGSLAFYTETKLNIDPTIPCNHPIGFSIPPVDKACKGISFTHNPGAFETDGDSLSYELMIPKSTATSNVTGFAKPNDPKFYGGLNYQQANEAHNGPPIFAVDAITGTLTWDSPGFIGEYETTIRVTEWRKSNGTWTILGYVVRDMQIIVEDCQDTRPVLQMPKDICVSPGDNISQIIRAFDAEFDNVRIEMFTTDNFFGSAPVSKNLNVLQSTRSPYDTAMLRFSWSITCDLVRDQPYTIIFKVTDQRFNGVKLSTFYTWTITVIGAPPKFKNIQLDVATETLKVEWEPYVCPNAGVMEVWRRVGKFNYAHENCRRGIPRALGFEKIGSVSNSTFFLDKNLSPGAEYCYRLVAQYQTPAKSFSIVSDATCVGPLLVDAPVITNVSVVKTDSLDGRIMVRWTSPFQINKASFPPPYEYEVYRTDNKTNVFVNVLNHRVTDTTYVDSKLNLSKLVYGYKIVVYSPAGLTGQTPLDTSSLAFYPRLSAAPQPGSVYLQWDAVVPWSIQSERYPYHYIYRRDSGNPFELIDSVDVNSLVIDKGFEYVDKGSFKKRKLGENTLYRYRISTSGVYGNPRIKEPLVNFSNEVLAQPIDHSPPCKPILSLVELSCDNFKNNYACNFDDYWNTLTWEYPEDCGDDISHFELFYATTPKEAFKLIATTANPTYIHHKQSSFIGCYKIRAIDRTGNVGAESDSTCAENCPYIFIPNVFTPGNKDGLNDFFPGITRIDLTKTDPSKCPRFVKSLDLQIFNRFGQEVYAVTSLFSQPALEWSGLDEHGRELPSGIYFYSANVVFETLDPAQQVKIVKGWVNLIR